jgi:hypothetical protein
MRVRRWGIFGLPSSWLEDDWLVSPIVTRIFLSAAVCLIALIPLFLGWFDPRNLPAWLQLPWTVVGMLIATDAIFLMLGMWRYWVRLDDSVGAWKRIWFFVLLLGFCYGSCAYYFLVYLPQVVRKRHLYGV